MWCMQRGFVKKGAGLVERFVFLLVFYSFGGMEMVESSEVV